MTQVVTRSQVRAAAVRLSGQLRETPLLTVDGAELGTAGTVSFKLEYLQHSGSFKARGAMNFMLTNTVPEAGVAAASGGNHGAAVAWAAQQLGISAHIFVPTIASPVKVERLRSYGAEVTQTGAVYAEALEACNRFVATSGAMAIHAYDDPAVAAGAGTTGYELEMQSTPLDTVLVACGGGGLSSGIAAWFAGGNRPVELVVCETDGTATYARALDAGEPVEVTVSGIAADSLGATRIGASAFETLIEARARSVLVTDQDVRATREFMWDEFRMLVEPAAATPIAALLTRRYEPGRFTHTGVIVCGANTPLEHS